MSSILPKNKWKNSNQQYYDSSDRIVFVCFLEELRIPKSPFEINWSLIGTTVKKGVFAEQVFVLGEQLNCL